ncbi:MAG: DUF4405 domain-containing protein [Helicobacteraceae bacterium]|jgi:hypothetical protein|nr:DUF4405 domain-containing protein [Helicobacteraceae bacterium]
MSEKIVVKKIVSLTLSFSFLVMSLTGIMLFIVPKGKVAYWANWKMFGLTKTQYADIHITSMILFIVITVWHIYYNWKPLISYLKNSTKQITFFKKELLIALLLNALFVAGALMAFQPFKTVLDINEGIKTYWEKQYGSPPFGHAEESSFKAFSQQIGIDFDKATALLKEKGITVENNKQTLQQIAEQNGISAKDIYESIKPQQSKTGSEVTSLGRRSLEELAGMEMIDLEMSLQFLQKQGFDATPESKVREAANALGLTPYTLFEQLKALKQGE